MVNFLTINRLKEISLFFYKLKLSCKILELIDIILILIKIIMKLKINKITSMLMENWMCLMSQNNLDLSNNQATWLLCNVCYSSYKNNKKKHLIFFLNLNILKNSNFTWKLINHIQVSYLKKCHRYINAPLKSNETYHTHLRSYM